VKVSGIAMFSSKGAIAGSRLERPDVALVPGRQRNNLIKRKITKLTRAKSSDYSIGTGATAALPILR